MDIHVDNLGIHYDGRTLFENVSFEVCSGQKICIDGPSGCGKSSLLRAMLGFVRPQQGIIRFGDTLVDDKTIWQLRHRIAYVTQEPDLGQQIVLERIRQPFTYKTNTHLQWNQQAVEEWLGRFNLPRKLLNKQTADLSGGEKQRVAIIIAILLDRPILLLDEPASALDKQSKRILRDVLTDLQKTIVFISHEDVLTDIADVTIQLAPAEGGSHG
jgi:ABC-type iron transport system FetAB ATPase subunit